MIIGVKSIDTGEDCACVRLWNVNAASSDRRWHPEQSSTLFIHTALRRIHWAVLSGPATIPARSSTRRLT